MNTSLHTIDALIVLGYLAVVLAIGLRVGRGQLSTTDYFLAGRSLPGWALLLSIVATETSTVTFLSIPGITFAQGGDFRFLQITIGYIVGRLLVVGLLLPLYFRGQPFTAYEVLERRFGVASRRITSVLFIVTRNLSDALRLFLTALALQQAIGLSVSSCVVVLGVITIAYTFFGGVKSVVWNDCIQFVVYMIGAVIALVVILRLLPGGAGQLWEFAQANEKLRWLDFDLSWTAPNMTFWAGLIGGAFLTGATHGTDQMMVQRYLSAKSQRAAGWAVGLSGLVVCVQFAIFLLIGVGLACYYNIQPPETAFADGEGDQVFSHFIVHHLPRGLVGLTLAAVFAAAMSTLSSSLNSSATALVNDLYVPLRKEEMSQAALLRLSRVTTIGFGIVQIGIALISQQLGAGESTVLAVLTIAAFATGPVLGLYLVAVLAPRVGQQPALIGFVLGLCLLSFVALNTDVYWTWYAFIGSVSTFVFASLCNLFLPGVASENDGPL